MAGKVAILMGSKSDLPKLEGGINILKDFGVPVTVRVMSAHRTPDVVADFVSNAADNGYKVIICAAGMAAHLGGVAAAHTLLPVIGIPIDGGALNGVDALYATVQMPPGIAVATVGIGSSGAKNAALIAVQILALSEPELMEKLAAFRRDQRRQVTEADQEVQALHNR
ncbi:MAG: 5-(carboxyamino)imidazole ribonucleotide mutase [Lentisphaeria bacterium]|nr:5-(carboxyamino)imidazole ribonucleotide mutase [Lentisphaeria bacterium]